MLMSLEYARGLKGHLCACTMSNLPLHSHGICRQNELLQHSNEALEAEKEAISQETVSQSTLTAWSKFHNLSRLSILHGCKRNCIAEFDYRLAGKTQSTTEYAAEETAASLADAPAAKDICEHRVTC